MVAAPELHIATTRENIPEVDNTLFERTTLPLAAPAVGATVSVHVADSSRYAVGMRLYFGGVGTFVVTNLYNGTTIVVENVNATAGGNIPIGTVFQSAGAPYTPEESGTAESFLTDALAQAFNAPSAGGTSDLYVVDGGWLALLLWVYIPGLGWYRIHSLDASDTTHCVVEHVNTDTSVATLGSTSGSASTGQPVLVYPPPQFRPDNTTLEATNAGGVPGNALLKVKDNYLNGRVSIPGVTSPVMLSGAISVTAPGVVTDSLLATVTFGTAFSTTPTVAGLSIECDSDLGANLLELNLYVRDVSTTGFKLYGTQATGAVSADFAVNWIALGT